MFYAPAAAAHRAAMVCCCACLALFATPSHAGFNLFLDGGDATNASIQPTIDAFRAALGGPNNGNNAGPLASGRREINWDGGGAITASVTAGALAAFQNTRGATFTTPGTGFLQTPLNVTALTDVNATYSTTFSAFSPVRIFVPTGSNITDTIFSLPGSSGLTPATVSGFGAVFSDVDLANLTSLEFFDAGDVSLKKIFAPTGSVASGSLSFLGAIANAGERIARVRITTGNTALGPNDFPGDGIDVVVMGDFIYAEPGIVPEPASAVLALLGVQAAALLARHRRT
ncbi:MAG: PEP-CTERM sorting domain-containing protein [Pirellulales bacterium]